MNTQLRSLTSPRSWATRKRSLASRHTFRPSFELLETRNLLTTFLVDTTLDDPAADATVTDGFVSLREAVRAANEDRTFGDAAAGQSDEVDRIIFSPALSGKTIELKGAELTIEEDLVLEGLGQDQLTVSGGGTTRILWIDAEANVDISGVALTHGKAPAGGGEDYGGAIVNFGTLTIQGSLLSMNAALEGGAMLNVGAAHVVNSAVTGNTALAGGGIENVGELHVVNSTISDNAADNGGAIANYGGAVKVSASTLQNNHATGSGAAIFSFGGNVILEKTAVTQNTAAADGGGVFTGGGTLTVAQSTFVENSATGGGGVATQDGNVTIEFSTFEGNSATFYGGGIHAVGVSSLNINSSTFTENHAGRGGAVRSSVYTNTRIANSTFSGNVSLTDGGGIYNSGPLLVTHSTFTGNRADADGDDALPEGGGIFSGVEAQPGTTITNSIIAGNFHGSGQEPDDIGGLIGESSAFNLVGDAATAGGLAHGVNGNIVGNAGSGTIDITSVLDPQLADNGGLTLTHALVVGSPAIDAANSSLQYDQREWWRMVDGNGDGVAASDMGAYEHVTLDALWTTLGNQIEELHTQDTLSRGEAQRLAIFLQHVGAADPSTADHFLGLFHDHLNRLVNSGDLSHATADLIEVAISSISEGQQGEDEQQALDALFAEFEFGWGIVD